MGNKRGYSLAFVVGFVLALLVIGSSLGTYTLASVSSARHGEIVAQMEAQRAQIELRAALQRVNRRAARAREETRQAEEKLRQLGVGPEAK